MVYAFKTHESSAGDTVGKLRWIAGKAMKSTSASSETAKMARLVMAKTVQGDERTVTMGAIRCSFLYISMSMQRGVVLGVYTPNRQKKLRLHDTYHLLPHPRVSTVAPAAGTPGAAPAHRLRSRRSPGPCSSHSMARSRRHSALGA